MNQRFRVVQEVLKGVLSADPAIKGVGASQTHRHRPASIVPRSEFPKRAGVVSEKELESKRRLKVDKETVTLVSPVLLADTPRRWRVIGSSGEFGASVKDEAFLEDLVNGRVNVPLVSNIKLIVMLETKERFEDGAWVITERNILKVVKTIPPKTQGAFDLPPASPSVH